MALSTRSQVTVAGLAVVVAAAVAAIVVYVARPGQSSDHWPKDQRSAFIDSCNKNCRNSPGVTPDRYPLCDKACACAADEGEKILSGEDLVQIYLAQSSGKATKEQSEKMQKLSRAALGCVTGALANQK